MKRYQYLVLTLLVLFVLLGLTVAEAGTRIRVGVGFHVGGPHHRAVFVSHYHMGAPYYHRFGFHRAPVIRVNTGNVGRVDFNIEPPESQVYVDGALIGTADDYNGGFFGETATLRAGKHRIRVVSPDGQVVVRDIYVMPGKEIDFNLIF